MYLLTGCWQHFLIDWEMSHKLTKNFEHGLVSCSINVCKLAWGLIVVFAPEAADNLVLCVTVISIGSPLKALPCVSPSVTFRGCRNSAGPLQLKYLHSGVISLLSSMNRQDTYPQTKHSDPEPLPALSIKSMRLMTQCVVTSDYN